MSVQTEVTEDRLLGGRVILAQPARGYRVNVDTILLAAAVTDGETLMEAGCGVGGALLCAAHRLSAATLLGVERDAGAAALARANAAANAMSGRVTIIEGDALDAHADWGVFDGVFFNPPYDSAASGRAPAPERAGAHVAERAIDDWVKALSNRLRGDGVMTLIHRAARLAEILSAFEGRLGGVEILPIRPRADAAASRVIVRGRKGSRAPMALWPGYDLHDSSGAKHTPEIEAVLRGEAALDWGAASL